MNDNFGLPFNILFISGVIRSVKAKTNTVSVLLQKSLRNFCWELAVSVIALWYTAYRKRPQDKKNAHRTTVRSHCCFPTLENTKVVDHSLFDGHVDNQSKMFRQIDREEKCFISSGFVLFVILNKKTTWPFFSLNWHFMFNLLCCSAVQGLWTDAKKNSFHFMQCYVWMRVPWSS